MKKMSKIFTTVLAAALATAFISCGGKQSMDGKWTSVDDASATITLKESNHSYVVTQGSASIEGTYMLVSGGILSDGMDSSNIILSDTGFIADVDETSLSFQGPVVNKASDLNGTYVAELFGSTFQMDINKSAKTISTTIAGEVQAENEEYKIEDNDMLYFSSGDLAGRIFAIKVLGKDKISLDGDVFTK